MSVSMKAPDVFWLEEIIPADGFYRMVGADLAKNEAAKKRGCRYILATPEALAECLEVAKMIAEAVAAERERCAKAGGDTAVEILLRHDPEPGPLKIQMTRQAIAAAIRSEATK